MVWIVDAGLGSDVSEDLLSEGEDDDVLERTCRFIVVLDELAARVFLVVNLVAPTLQDPVVLLHVWPALYVEPCVETRNLLLPVPLPRPSCPGRYRRAP